MRTSEQSVKEDRTRMWSLNRVRIVGVVDSDPAARVAPGHAHIAPLTVTVERHRASPGREPQAETARFLVELTDELSEACARRLRKGALAYVEGRLDVRTPANTDSRGHERVVIVAQTIGLVDCESGQIRPGGLLIPEHQGEPSSTSHPWPTRALSRVMDGVSPDTAVAHRGGGMDSRQGHCREGRTTIGAVDRSIAGPDGAVGSWTDQHGPLPAGEQPRPTLCEGKPE